MHSERINGSFSCRKTLTSHFTFYISGINRSHSVPSQDYTADDLSNRCFESSKMQLFKPMKSDLCSAVGFPDFLEDNWQTNVTNHEESEM